MTVRFNDQLVLWAIGVLQPATVDEALRFMSMVFKDLGPLPEVQDVQPTVDRWVEGGQLIRVHARPKLYSVTAKGNHLMSVRLRRSRDKARIFLLKEARLTKVQSSGDALKRLAGDSPAETVSSSTQEARPIDPVVVTLRDAPAALNAVRAYWPRVFKQLQVGSDRRSPDTFFDLYSFPSAEVIHSVSDRPSKEGGSKSYRSRAGHRHKSTTADRFLFISQPNTIASSESVSGVAESELSTLPECS